MTGSSPWSTLVAGAVVLAIGVFLAVLGMRRWPVVSGLLVIAAMAWTVTTAPSRADAAATCCGSTTTAPTLATAAPAPLASTTVPPAVATTSGPGPSIATAAPTVSSTTLGPATPPAEVPDAPMAASFGVVALVAFATLVVRSRRSSVAG